MSVIKLTSEHVSMVASMFDAGTSINYEIFCSNYLSDLNNFHAFGYIENNSIKAIISFYESVDEPAWYYMSHKSIENINLLNDVLDEVIKYNESNNRLKFYTLDDSLDRLHWNNHSDKKYGYFDEFVVPSKTKCFYINAWELLYKRTVLPNDSVVRCNYLKQKYRHKLPVGGNL